MIVRKPKVHPNVVALTHKINTAKAANRNVPEWVFVAAGDLARVSIHLAVGDDEERDNAADGVDHDDMFQSTSPSETTRNL